MRRLTPPRGRKGARVAVDVVLNRRYAGTHCSVWRYLLVSLTPVEKGA